MAKNLPVAQQDYRVTTYQTISGETITLSLETVRNFLVTGKKELVTEQEMVFFMGVARAKGMNPFARDCYLVKFDQSPAAIIVAIDFCRARARAQADCRGWQKGVICLQKDGSLRYSNGLVLADETLVGGWFEAQPHGWDVPFKLEGFNVIALNVTKLRTDNQDPKKYMERVADWKSKVEKAKGDKCQRCWNYSEEVGNDKTHPALCERCVKAVQT